MAELKTRQHDGDVFAFIDTFVGNAQKRVDSLELVKLMQRVTGYPPRMWGPSMIGFGRYHYRSERSSQEGDWPLVAFSPRKAAFSLYVYSGLPEHEYLLKDLGKYTIGKACIYVKRLSDIDPEALERLIRATIGFLEDKYGKKPNNAEGAPLGSCGRRAAEMDADRRGSAGKYKKKWGARMPFDFRKIEKELYQPKAVPSVIDVPQMTFIVVDGEGDPNTCPAYAQAVALLYGLSYTIRMGSKTLLEYVVSPLEGFWSLDDAFRGGGAAIHDKSKFIWTMAIRQPDFVTEELFESARTALAKKKRGLDVSPARLQTIHEGLCVQVMHTGPYDDEPATIAALDRFAVENGYAIDIGETRRHHEIYISDPRKVAPEKLKTVLRHPVRRV